MEEKEYFVTYMGTIKKVLLKEILPGKFEDKYHQIYWKNDVFSSKEKLSDAITSRIQKKNFELTAKILKIKNILPDISKNLSHDLKTLSSNEQEKIIDNIIAIALKQIEDFREELRDNEEFLNIQLESINKL